MFVSTLTKLWPMTDIPYPYICDRQMDQYSDPCLDTNNVVILPAQHIMRSFHDGYISECADDSTKLVWETFCHMARQERPFIRVSLRTRGI